MSRSTPTGKESVAPIAKTSQTFREIPVIDIAALRSDNALERSRVGAEIRDAAQNVGFFYVVNHGVPSGAIEGIKQAAQQFFSLPMEKKMELYIGNTTNLVNKRVHRGYTPEGEEGFSDEGFTDPEEQHDRKEAFDLGRDLAPTHPLVQQGLPFHGPNRWPSDLPGFRERVEAYYNAVFDVSKQLIAGFALALGVDEDVIARDFTEQLAAFRLIRYPASDTKGGPQGISAHTDYECFTILYSDTPGLEVVNGNKEWIPVKPIPEAFVVNIGDTLEILTNKRFVATAHRVQKVPQERYSFPMFVGCNYNTLVAPLPQFVDSNEPAHYGNTKSGDHVWERVQGTYRYLNT